MWGNYRQTATKKIQSGALFADPMAETLAIRGMDRESTFAAQETAGSPN
jgi:hypothetical protein